MHVYTHSLGDWELVAVPGRGGALAACRFQGRSILREATDIAEADGLVTRSAAYPMVPFCGRIAAGRFTFDGVDYQLAPNFPPEPHAIHGTGWQSRWAIEVESGRLAMTLMDDTLRWPWPFMARQVFSVRNGALQLDLSVTNIGERAMLAGLGWHPFFNAAAANGDVTLQVDVGSEVRAETGKAASAALTAGTEVSTLEIDKTFDWPTRTAALVYPDGQRVTLSACDATKCVTLYRVANRDFICVEPLTHWPDAHNRAEPLAAGLVHLAPGKTLRQVVRLEVS